MIALVILGVIIALILFLLLLPISVDLFYNQSFVLKIKYLGITLYNNQKVKKTKNKTQSGNGKNKKTKHKKDNFIVSTYKQRGLLGTVNYLSDLASIFLKRFVRLLKHIKFRRFKLDITVATSDATNTAIQYGKICAAVYPIVSALEANCDLKAKEINVSADFDKNKSEFKTSISIKTQVIYLLAIAIGALLQFVKLQRKESEKNEREQSKDCD